MWSAGKHAENTQQQLDETHTGTRAGERHQPVNRGQKARLQMALNVRRMPTETSYTGGDGAEQVRDLLLKRESTARLAWLVVGLPPTAAGAEAC